MLLAASPLSPQAYIGGGLIVLALILFAETGLLIGFFLPGDTLLLLAGSYTVTKAGQSIHLNFLAAAVVGIVAAFLGAQTGFLLGRRVGPRLFDRPSRREKLERTERVLHRVGEGKAVVAARFIPVVRTFMNPALGLGTMSARDFSIWNAVGAVLWVPPVLLLGRLVGAAFPLDKIVIAIVVISLLLPLVELVRSRRRTTTSPRP